MNSNLLSLIKKEGLKQDEDGIYLTEIISENKIQDDERELRVRVSSVTYDNYLDVISKNHSIPVMDYEVDVFLKKMPQGAVILDIGGCWGWHWRRIGKSRPDISILIIDFVKSNLTHALNVVKDWTDICDLMKKAETDVVAQNIDETQIKIFDIKK